MHLHPNQAPWADKGMLGSLRMPKQPHILSSSSSQLPIHGLCIFLKFPSHAAVCLPSEACQQSLLLLLQPLKRPAQQKPRSSLMRPALLTQKLCFPLKFQKWRLSPRLSLMRPAGEPWADQDARHAVWPVSVQAPSCSSRGRVFFLSHSSATGSWASRGDTDSHT